MKISIWWLLAVPVLIAGIASSQAGFSVVWDYEMKRPEAQKAIQQYIASHCTADLWLRDLNQAQQNSTGSSSVPAHVQIYCWSDEHQK